MYFEVYRDTINNWRWRLWSSNGRIIADSAEGYVNKSDCLNGIDLVKSAYSSPVVGS